MAYQRKHGLGIVAAVFLLPVAYLLSFIPLEYAKNHEYILQDPAASYLWIYPAYCRPYLYFRNEGPQWLRSPLTAYDDFIQEL